MWKQLKYEWKYQDDRYNHLCFIYNFIFWMSLWTTNLWATLTFDGYNSLGTVLSAVSVMFILIPCIGASYGGGPGRFIGEWLIELLRTKEQQNQLDRLYRLESYRWQLQQMIESIKPIKEHTFVMTKAIYTNSTDRSSSKSDEKPVYTSKEKPSTIYGSSGSVGYEVLKSFYGSD